MGAPESAASSVNPATRRSPLLAALSCKQGGPSHRTSSFRFSIIFMCSAPAARTSEKGPFSCPPTQLLSGCSPFRYVGVGVYVPHALLAAVVLFPLLLGVDLYLIG